MTSKGQRKGKKKHPYYIVLANEGLVGTFKTREEALQKLRSRRKLLISKHSSDGKLLSSENWDKKNKKWQLQTRRKTGGRRSFESFVNAYLRKH